jgi:sigma-B regulation protein RsbU (phosphoserine phosphatase)
MLHVELEDREDMWNSPGAILKKLNVGLRPRLISMMYTAMSLCILQTEEERLLLANAGMPYPIIKRGNKAWELEVNGMPLGITDMAEYDELSVDLGAGDFVIFYSDGVIEATDETDGMYQTERLLEVVKQADSDFSALDMIDWITQDVSKFAGNVDLSDDITIVVLRCNRV